MVYDNNSITRLESTSQLIAYARNKNRRIIIVHPDTAKVTPAIMDLVYVILNEDKPTVTESDRCLTGIISGIQAFIDSHNNEKLLNDQAQSGLQAEIDSLTKQYINDLLQVNVAELNYQANKVDG